MTEAERIFNGQLFASEVPEARNRVLRDLPDSVTIGDHCSFAPNVTIVTPLHPMPGSERRGVIF